MTEFRLDEVAVIHGGGRLGLSGNDFVADGVPAYGAGGQNGMVATAEYDRKAIVLSSIGARCGKCFHVQGQWTSLANTQVILPDESRVDSRFLWYQLNDEARWPRSGSAQPFIKPSDVKAHRIWLPPLDEQRRIAGILNQANAIRFKRGRSIADLDDLSRAIFLDMFGEMNEGLRSVADVAAREKGSIRTGPFGSQLLHSEFVDEGIAVLGIDNVVTNRFRWHGQRHVTPEKYEKLKRYTVVPGDVLITIMGTCGRCVVVPESIPTAINTKHICAITVDRAQVFPEFLRGCFLWHPASRRFLLQQAKGAIMNGLNMGIIKEMPMPVPPQSLQAEFVRRARTAERLYEAAVRSKQEVEQLFSTLRSRAFAGQL